MRHLLSVFILMTSTSVLAFGGGGSGRVGQAYQRGLNALGIHIGGEDNVDIQFSCDDPLKTWDGHGVCVCKAGYEDINGRCVHTLPKNVPCGDGFCYEGQTCVDAELSDDRLYCGNGMKVTDGKCCKDKLIMNVTDTFSCPTQEATTSLGGDCQNCNGSNEFAIRGINSNENRAVCCQKGTGAYKYRESEYAFPVLGTAEDICCTSQGGWVDESGYFCCDKKGRDIQGRWNAFCCENDEYLIGKKSDGSYEAISRQNVYPSPSISAGDDRGYFNPIDYVEFHCCDFYNSAADEGDNKRFCDSARAYCIENSCS